MTIVFATVIHEDQRIYNNNCHFYVDNLLFHTIECIIACMCMWFEYISLIH